LTYHRVAEDPQDPFAVSPLDFVRQMEIVAQTGVAEPLESALANLGADKGEQPRVALTFDDGTRDFLTEALPVLLRLRLPATLYVSPSRVGEIGFLSWDDVVEVARSGVRIGSHGWDHQSLGRLDLMEVRQQVTMSRGVLEDRLGIEVTTLAYPYGTLRDFSEGVKEEVRRAGYLAACTSVNGVNRCTTDSFELRRTKIEQGDGSVFWRILCGGLDAWALIDQHLPALQNRYA
jgi:peptidoglycan/xylan/chitin deacetylase (PgdA/CDA1 family)